MITFRGVDLTGSVITIYVKPLRNGNGATNGSFTITSSGVDPKLIIDSQLYAQGKVTLYISDVTLNAFTWSKAEYRLEVVDTLGDRSVKFQGYMSINPVLA